jgi:hypothetical protein
VNYQLHTQEPLSAILVTRTIMASGTKRKSNYKTDDFVASDNSEDRPAKRGKSTTKASTTTKSSFVVSKEAQTDANGDTFWEISKNRRVALSEFKGMSMINIREYYEQNGKSLPGKKVGPLCHVRGCPLIAA